MVLLLLTKLINGLVNAYRAPSGTSFRGRLMLLVLRLLFNKDYLERNKDEAVYLRIAEEVSVRTSSWLCLIVTTVPKFEN